MHVIQHQRRRPCQSLLGSPLLPGLTAMAGHGLVELLEGPHGRLAYLTQSATDLGMQQCWGLANPKAACKPRPDCALEDASEYELLRMMLDVGWHWGPWSSAKKIPLALREFPNEYRRGGEKIWRTTGVQLQRTYLLALLRSEDLENAPCFM